MKNILICLFLGITALFGLSPTDCPPEGGRKDGTELKAHEKLINKKKNRSARKPSKAPEIIGIEKFLNGRKINKDKQLWKEGTYVEINDAYLITHEEEGAETCNCQMATGGKDNPLGDVHINLSRRENWKNRNNDFYMVVEITPSYKKLHPKYSTELKKLAGKKVTVRGYLFYDVLHEHNSLNYCKKCSGKSVWRKTCWEIHPITYIGLTK